MRVVSMEEYEDSKKPTASWVGPIYQRINRQFHADESIKVIEIEEEDIPENERYRMNSGSAEIQKLAGLFRSRVSPLDDLYISVANGKLYVVRGKRPKSAYKLR